VGNKTPIGKGTFFYPPNDVYGKNRHTVLNKRLIPLDVGENDLGINAGRNLGQAVKKDRGLSASTQSLWNRFPTPKRERRKTSLEVNRFWVRNQELVSGCLMRIVRIRASWSQEHVNENRVPEKLRLMGYTYRLRGRRGGSSQFARARTI